MTVGREIDDGEAARRLLADALSVHKEERDDLSASWHQATSRAKGAIVLTLLVAATIGVFIRRAPEEATPVETYLLSGSAGCAALSFLVSIAALLYRRNALDEADRESDVSRHAASRMDRYREHMLALEESNARLDSVIRRRFRVLLFGQACLTVAILSASVAIFMQI